MTSRCLGCPQGVPLPGQAHTCLYSLQLLWKLRLPLARSWMMVQPPRSVSMSQYACKGSEGQAGGGLEWVARCIPTRLGSSAWVLYGYWGRLRGWRGCAVPSTSLGGGLSSLHGCGQGLGSGAHRSGCL